MRAGSGSRTLVLAAMIFAVSMTFIDQTIVSIAAPNIQSELGLTATGVQWAINAYLLTLAAFFAFGGRLADTVGPASIDFRGLVVLASGVALSIVGFQQSATWGWGDARTIGCIVVGALLLVVFGFLELRTQSPLIDIRIFRIRPFLVENLVLGTSNLVFIPVFFFASEYAQIALGKSASSASLLLLWFFLGFVTAAQIGGRMLDRIGAKRPVVVGCALAAVGFWLWATKVTSLDSGKSVPWIIVAGAGMGFMLGPASTDAVNRASRLSYGEATGITQTVRNYAASLGLAVLGSLSVSQLHSRVTTSLVGQGLPHAQASVEASKIAQERSGTHVGAIPHFIQLDFAYAIRSVLYAMAIIMGAAAVIAFLGLRRGVQQEEPVLAPETA